MGKLVNWESLVARKALPQPVRFSLPRLDPLLGSNRARFSASFRSSIRFAARCLSRFLACSSLNTMSSRQCNSFSIPPPAVDEEMADRSQRSDHFGNHNHAGPNLWNRSGLERQPDPDGRNANGRSDVAAAFADAFSTPGM